VNGVVVGVDGSPGSVVALRFAAEEARLSGTTLHVVGAWEVPATAYAGAAGGAGSGFVELGAELESRAREAVDEALARLDAGDVAIERHVNEGHAARLLLEAGAGADLLVVGSRGLGGFARLLLGSVGQELAHHAPCPLAIVPNPEA
jgi:nucleotide-binding universal stress UspA family protein